MLLNDLRKYRIILASRSPRRQMLLSGLGIDFDVLVHDRMEESYPEHTTREQVPVYLAEKKSFHIMDEIPAGTLLITADTIVWLNGRVIGKPADREEAVRFLGELSGSVHEVLTGVCLRTAKSKRLFSASSLVHFCELTREEINYYIDLYEPYDKAGAYGVQEWIGYAGIERIEGSYFNVMGLPVQKLYAELKKMIPEEIQAGE